MMQHCSFTGHRSIPKGQERALALALAARITMQYEQGCRNFYSGGAMGFDLLAAEQILTLRSLHPEVRLYMILPHKKQASAYSAEDLARYRRVLSEADGVEYTSEHYYDGVMRDRNARLAELCDVCIAYVTYDRSGSAQTVRMCQRQGKPVFNIANDLLRG